MALSAEEIRDTDLEALVAAGTPEGIFYDYKRSSYGRADADKHEFLKDVSSFANTAGGHLIIGMAEESGVPTGIVALQEVDRDEELQRLENLARDGLEPRIVGLRMKAIPTVSGGFAILVRVPRSAYPPHRVAARNSNRIYARNSAGAYELSLDELRVLFTSGSTALERARAFRGERLAKLDAGEAILPLAVDLGRVVLHLVPLTAFGMPAPVDLARAQAAQHLLRPMNSMGLTARINFDGFGTFNHGADGRCWRYTQLFRNGAVEAVKVRAAMEQNGKLLIPSLDLERHIFEVLPGYLDALEQLGIVPPIAAMITLQGVRGAALGTDTPFDDPTPVERATLELPEVLIQRFGTNEDYHRALRPAFDALWNSAGFLRSPYFDEDGRWVGAPQLGARGS